MLHSLTAVLAASLVLTLLPAQGRCEFLYMIIQLAHPQEPGPTVPAGAGGYKAYTVPEGGRLFFQIARDELGNGDRWSEIYGLNSQYDPQQMVPAGAQLKLPAEAPPSDCCPFSGCCPQGTCPGAATMPNCPNQCDTCDTPCCEKRTTATEGDARRKPRVVTFPVADLIFAVEKRTHQNDLVRTHWQSAINQQISKGGVSLGRPSPYGVPSAQPADQGNTEASRPPQPKNYQGVDELLMRLITTSIAPESWSDVGGKGTIQYYPLGLALVVNQTPDIEQRISDLLGSFRCMLALQGDNISPSDIKNLTAFFGGNRCCQECSESCECGAQAGSCRVNKPEVCACGFDCGAAFKRQTEEMQKMSAEHERTIQELEATVKELCQGIAALREEVQSLRAGQIPQPQMLFNNMVPPPGMVYMQIVPAGWGVPIPPAPVMVPPMEPSVPK